MLIWSKNKTFFKKKKKTRWCTISGSTNKKFIMALLKSLNAQVWFIILKFKWPRYLEIMYFGQNERDTKTIGSHEQLSSIPPHSFIHSLIQLPLPSTELCRRNVKMIKVCLCPQEVCNLFTERSQLCKTPEQRDICFNRNVCTEDRRNTEECLDWKVRKRKAVRGSWFSSPGHEEENLESDPKKLWQEVRKTRRSHFIYLTVLSFSLPPLDRLVQSRETKWKNRLLEACCCEALE